MMSAQWTISIRGQYLIISLLENQVLELDRVVLAKGGNFGIATTTPDEKLHVVGNARIARANKYPSTSHVSAYWNNTNSGLG
jgi:hypothetical protein